MVTLVCCRHGGPSNLCNPSTHLSLQRMDEWMDGWKERRFFLASMACLADPAMANARFKDETYLGSLTMQKWYSETELKSLLNRECIL